MNVPATVQVETDRRIRELAARRFPGQFTRLDVRFRGVFCYVSACVEPVVPNDSPVAGPETRAEWIERLRDTPTPLCRLRHYSRDLWCLALFVYSSEAYETTRFPSGDFWGQPEDGFELAARFHFAVPA